MRQNIEAHCDALARLPISNRIESLNVSNAAAIALYAARVAGTQSSGATVTRRPSSSAAEIGSWQDSRDCSLR